MEGEAAVTSPRFSRGHHRLVSSAPAEGFVHDKRLINRLRRLIQRGTRVDVTEGDQAPVLFGDEHGMVSGVRDPIMAPPRFFAVQRIPGLGQHHPRGRTIVDGHRTDRHDVTTIPELAPRENPRGPGERRGHAVGRFVGRPWSRRRGIEASVDPSTGTTAMDGRAGEPARRDFNACPSPMAPPPRPAYAIARSPGCSASPASAPTRPDGSRLAAC
jgi:hypothetical protein